MIKAILFDLDGTLLDSIPIIMQSAKETFEAMGLPYDETAMRNSIGIPLRVQARRYAGERALEFIDCYREIYRLRQDRDIRLFPHTPDMLSQIRLRGYRTGVVTSKAVHLTRRALERTEILDKFDVLVTADDVQNHKPHPEPIFKALEMLSLSPRDAAYVGDSLFDIDAAQRAQVTTIGVTWGARNRQELELTCADQVFDSWQELLTWLP